MQSIEKCTGCGACYNICPHQAIVMGTDEAGFCKFEKDFSLCTGCGQCDAVCASLCENKKENRIQKVFAAWAKSDQIHARGNSGGLFEVAARAVFRENGVVAGAVYEKDFSVKLMIAQTEEQLLAMTGSKFVQSVPGHVYLDVKKYLEEDRTVLFVGAPCQVKALYAVLQKEYPKLITAQFPCFGMPTALFWKKYLQHVAKTHEGSLSGIGSEVQLTEDINSRYMAFTWESGDVSAERADTCAYIRAWNNGFSVSDVCAACRDNVFPVQADLVWGNFWHIGEIEKFSVPKKDYQNGVSMLLVNSRRGEAFFEKMKPDLMYYPRKQMEAAAPHFVFQSSGEEHFLFRKKYENPRRKAFQKDLSAMTYEQLEEKYFSQTKRETEVSISRKLGPKWAAWGWRALYCLQKIWMKRNFGAES